MDLNMNEIGKKEVQVWDGSQSRLRRFWRKDHWCWFF